MSNIHGLFPSTVPRSAVAAMAVRFLGALARLSVLGAILLQASGFSNSTTSVDNRQSVSILALAPYAGVGLAEPGWKGGPALIPAVRLAVDRINNRTDILSGYMIQLLEGNSGCQHKPRSVYSFVSNIFHDGAKKRTSNHVIGVIGPACSESALLLGTLGAKDSASIIQVSPSATSILLTDTATYRNTFRTLSTTLQHLHGVAELMAHNAWENVAVLHDSTRLYFSLIAEKFLSEHSANIGFDSEIDTVYHPLGELEAQYKVIVLLAGSRLTREVMCLAYHHQPQLIYPVYQWIIIEKEKEQFLANVQFMYNGKFYNCSRGMMKQAIEGAIFTTFRIIARESHLQPTDVDLTFKRYQELYAEYLQNHLEELTALNRESIYEADAEEYAVSYYDATWALALALNASLDQLSKDASVSFAHYKHGQPDITSIIRRHLSSLQFEGLMGRIAFKNSTHDSSTHINFKQCNNSESSLIAIYNGTDLVNVSSKARFVVDEFYHKVAGVHLAATTIVVLAVIILALYTLCLHGMFIIFGIRNDKSVKAASVNLSHFMFSGCYLILIRVSLIAVEYSNSWQTRSTAESLKRDVILGVICNVDEWLNSIGISLVMGTLCGKLWRIYRLFNHFTTKRFLVSDETLTIFIASLVAINAILLLLWTAVDPLLADFEQQGIEYNGEDEPIIVERVHCRCEYFSVWITLIFALILAEVTGVVVLSLLNRHVNRRHFQTTKSVNLMIYLIAMLCFMGIGLAFVFQSLDIHYTYVSWQFSLLSIVCLVCVFMFSPPVYAAIKAQLSLAGGTIYKTSKSKEATELCVVDTSRA